MRTLTGVAITLTLAFVLTLLLSPSVRNNALQAIFNNKLGLRLPKRLDAYADRPLPPAHTGFRERTWKNGIEQ